jgi:DNA primase
VQAVLARILEMDAARRVAEIKAALSRAEDGTDDADKARLLGDLLSLESYRRDMRNFAVGDS